MAVNTDADIQELKKLIANLHRKIDIKASKLKAKDEFKEIMDLTYQLEDKINAVERQLKGKIIMSSKQVVGFAINFSLLSTLLSALVNLFW